MRKLCFFPQFSMLSRTVYIRFFIQFIMTPVFMLLIETVSLSGMVFAGCVKSGEQCCTGYVWNNHFKKCERCKSGFVGPSCDIMCPYPSYGFDCQMICNCTQTLCNFQYGCIRSSCIEGFYGPQCAKKCPYPSYGKGCQEICNCNNESCDHQLGCIAGALTSSRSFKGITSEAITPPETKVLSNESTLYMSVYSTGLKTNGILSSTFTLAQSEINLDKDVIYNNGSIVFTGNNNNMNKKTTTSGTNSLLILTISLNTFVIFIVCCIFVLCLFCKRKWVFQKIFENNKKGNLYDRNRLYAKERLFQEATRLSHKDKDVDIEMTEMTASVGNFINDNSVSVSLTQKRYSPHDVLVYENDIDPYLAPEITESESENHQYLTVV